MYHNLFLTSLLLAKGLRIFFSKIADLISIDKSNICSANKNTENYKGINSTLFN